MTGPRGSYVAEALASALDASDRWRRCVWARSADGDIARVADLLIAACGDRWTNGGNRTRPTSAVVAERALATAVGNAPASAAIVVEIPGRMPHGFERLLRHVRAPALDRGLSLVAVTEHRPRSSLAHAVDRIIDARDLVWTLDPSASPLDVALPSSCVRRLSSIGHSRRAIVHDIADSVALWSSDAIVDAVAAAPHWRSVLGKVTRNLLELAEPRHREALEICVAIGYWHPSLAADGVEAADLRPWIVPLEQRWGWLRPVWRHALAHHLRRATVLRARPVPPLLDHTVVHPQPTTPSVSFEVRMLGGLQIRVDGVAVITSPGHRGFALLRYLLSQSDRAAARDELLERFWPDVEPDVARNRLQVAVSSVRRVLREVSATDIIEYCGGQYRVSPHVALDIDVERFVDALAVARSAERAHAADEALAAYRRAVDMYRGDFASDVPYDDWTLLPRESLRLRYVDALDHMSNLLLSCGRIDECIATAHRMVDVDPCREDAHRLLMHCYARQGRAHQALRQFEFCRRALRTRLDVDPAPETMALRNGIRRGQVTSVPLRRPA